MKGKIITPTEEKKFKPIEVLLTITSPEEANLLASLLNEDEFDKDEFINVSTRIDTRLTGNIKNYNLASAILIELANQGYRTVTLSAPKPMKREKK